MIAIAANEMTTDQKQPKVPLNTFSMTFSCRCLASLSTGFWQVLTQIKGLPWDREITWRGFRAFKAICSRIQWVTFKYWETLHAFKWFCTIKALSGDRDSFKVVHSGFGATFCFFSTVSPSKIKMSFLETTTISLDRTRSTIALL